MKLFFKVLGLFSIFSSLFLISVPAWAQAVQNATPTQQTATRLDACATVATASGTAQQTLTLTPPAGQYIYVCSIEVISTATTAPVLSALTHTTTNLGSPTSIKFFDVFPAATGVVKTLFYPGLPLKSTTAGTAVTIVSNAAVTNITYNVTVTYYVAY